MVSGQDVSLNSLLNRRFHMFSYMGVSENRVYIPAGNLNGENIFGTTPMWI